MKRFFLFLSVLLLSAPLFAGTVVSDSIRSSKLNADVKYRVYLPDGFKDSKAHYPVVYLLHGLYGNSENWTEEGKAKDVADELILSGEAVPMVIIMPTAGDKDVHNVQNGYFNVEDWPYEDFFFGELMPQLEKKFRCGGDKAHRAIMGLSMGGGGSVVYCQQHPDMFSSCYAMSAWLDNRGDEVSSKSSTRDKLTIVCESVREHSALDFVEAADEATVGKLRSVKWFVDCGDDDWLLPLSEEFHQKMLQKKIPCEFRVRNGKHNWEYWRHAVRLALPFASRNFGR